MADKASLGALRECVLGCMDWHREIQKPAETLFFAEKKRAPGLMCVLMAQLLRDEDARVGLFCATMLHQVLLYVCICLL
jgi:hypothetical protein